MNKEVYIMKHHKLSIKLTEEQYKLLNAYQVLMMDELGTWKTKQDIMIELLLPILRITDESVSFGGR